VVVDTPRSAEGDPSGPRQSVDAWAIVEQARRDADADIYESFFTEFQTQSELAAYRRAFAGARAERGLEVGCGTGRTIDVLPGKRRIGINLARKELLVARERHGDRVDLIQASATHLPFRPGTFDAVLCAGVLHHIRPTDERSGLVSEVERVTRPGARIVLALHSYSWVVRQMFPHELEYQSLFWHRFSVPELRGLLSRNFPGARLDVRAICHLPRWRVGNRIGKVGVTIDGWLSAVPGLSRISGAILVARIERARKTDARH
jgi:SAM-dependent methyltransferase